MLQLSNFIQKSQHSKKHLWMLNRLMNHAVKFNKPHGFQIIKMSPEYVQTFAPYHKKNFNHVKGIHACAIATVGELAAGLLLMLHFTPGQYRVIMSHIDIDYHYQAKKNIMATASLPLSDKESILHQLNLENKTLYTVITSIKDEDQQLVATVKTTWQIKDWKNVRTQM